MQMASVHVGTDTDYAVRVPARRGRRLRLPLRRLLPAPRTAPSARCPRAPRAPLVLRGSRPTPPAQFSSRKDEQTLLRSTRIHGVKAADRGFLAATIDTDPAGAKAQSY